MVFLVHRTLFKKFWLLRNYLMSFWNLKKKGKKIDLKTKKILTEFEVFWKDFDSDFSWNRLIFVECYFRERRIACLSPEWKKFRKIFENFLNFLKKRYQVLFISGILLKRSFSIFYKISESLRIVWTIISFVGYPKNSVFGGYSEKMQKYKISKSRFIMLYIRLKRTYTGLCFV